MFLVVASIPNTGTRFVTRHLLKDYRIIHNGYDKTGNSFVQEHIGQVPFEVVSSLIDSNLIIPLRRLAPIIVSWERRDHSLVTLYRSLDELVTRYDELNPCYLPIDHPNRRNILKSVNKRLGTKLSTDWRVVSSQKGSAHATWKDVKNRDMAYMLNDKYSFFFERIYGERDQVEV